MPEVSVSKNIHYLQKPAGTESHFLEEAYRHQRIIRMVEDHFSCWGFLPVTTPVFDFFESYREFLGREGEHKCYRFTDRDGALLMLRSDITLFLAKQLAIRLRGSKKTTRVYYADNILRHEAKHNINSDELFQSGAELIGSSAVEADVEMLILLYDLLEKLSLPAWRIHLGSRAIIDALLEGRCQSSRLFHFLDIRDYDGLCKTFSALGLSNPARRAELLFFMGTPEEFNNLSHGIEILGDSPESRERIKDSIQVLRNICSMAHLSRTADNIRVDLSEHGEQPYYTGFTLRTYVEGASTSVAAGGRYDNLLQAFGHSSPAVGFSLFMRKLEPFIGVALNIDQKINVSSGDTFQARYKDASKRRYRGERVVLYNSSRRS